MELIYIKTDKNGTKIYHDWTCPRCGGVGEADKWMYTGRICYGCGGTGKRSRPQVVKEYTKEYQAKLDARRQKKAAAAAEAVAKYAEEHAEEIAAARQKKIERRYAEFGCGKDGIGYVLSGKTYPVKEEIRANGGRWIYGTWVCPVKVSGDGIHARRIDLSGHIGGGEEMWVDDFDLYDAMFM